MDATDRVREMTETSTETGSNYILDALEREGISTLFGLVGEGNAHLVDRTNDHALQFTYARHEQAAVTMADAYARMTGTVGVCTLTHGPGLTNGATGIAAADRDNVPLVVLVGDTGFAGRETSLQYLDHQSFTSPISAYQTRIETSETVPEAIRRAFGEARTERGPAVVEIPGDIQSAPAPETLYRPKPTPSQRPRPDQTTVEEAVSVLEDADAPVVLAGGGAMTADAAEPIVELAERIGAPIAVTYFAKGLFPEDHPLYSGIAGTFMSPANDELLWDADAVVTVGAQLSGKVTRYGELYADAAVVQIDIDPSAVGRYRDPTVALLGDASAAIEALVDRVSVDSNRVTRVATAIEEAENAFEFEPASTDEYVDPRVATREIAARVPDDTVVTIDSGNNTGFPAAFHPVGDGGRMLVNGNFGTMGFALPAALGAQVGTPDQTVLCYAGDGSLLQVVQEIETAVRLELPIIVVVLNDESYGIIRHRQRLEYGRETAADYSSSDFATVARGFGARGETIRSIDDLDILEEYCESEPSVPLVLDVRTNPDIARPGFPPY
ncbi:Acetolactate synthase large subunit [Natronorubrum texcoconense]|uniref:Acetolactate synthase large subunit n=2 Tax=Natronorubrum texcoconense TaxID=1095776 RepID=A0A1G9D0Y6_9EURY|nr:Acetolactate synthase large subunit [Natronorubrum texcoconense]